MPTATFTSSNYNWPKLQVMHEKLMYTNPNESQWHRFSIYSIPLFCIKFFSSPYCFFSFSLFHFFFLRSIIIIIVIRCTSIWVYIVSLLNAIIAGVWYVVHILFKQIVRQCLIVVLYGLIVNQTMEMCCFFWCCCWFKPEDIYTLQ